MSGEEREYRRSGGGEVVDTDIIVSRLLTSQLSLLLRLLISSISVPLYTFRISSVFSFSPHFSGTKITILFNFRNKLFFRVKFLKKKENFFR